MKNEHIKDNKVALYLAQKFHKHYEFLAPQFGYETKKETRKFDKESKNGKLMIAVCEKIISDLIV